MFGVPEHLEPDLDDHHGITWIHHPLIVSPIVSGIDYSEVIRRKTEMIETYQTKGDWHGFILAHERAYRLDALLEVIGKLKPKDHWPTVLEVWTDTEMPSINAEQWLDVFTTDMPSGRLGAETGKYFIKASLIKTPPVAT